MTKKRCFLAINVPAIQHYEKFLQRIKYDMDIKISITKPELYHFTVHFFGDISDEEVERINLHLQKLSINPFELELHDPGFIPNKNPRKARVLYINPSKGSNQIKQLVDDVKSKLRKEGFSISNRNYLPHLTVARIKHGRDREKLVDQWLSQTFPRESFSITNMQLIHSNLTPQGPIYTTLHTFG